MDGIHSDASDARGDETAMTILRSRSARRATIGAAAVLLLGPVLLWPVAASAASASTGTVPGSDRAAAVQTVLDRVLGPGNATVVVTDTVRTSTSRTTSVRWGSGVAASVAADAVVSAGGASTAVTQQNLVGGTTTVLTTPAGALVDQSVSVAVDRAHLGSTTLATLRRLVSATAGIVPSRGDRVSVVVTRFARPAPPTPVAVSPLATLLPYAVPAIWALGAVLALVILGAAVRGARRTVEPGAQQT